MKIRTGFVSNSSTSSFCVIGVSSESIIRKLLYVDQKWSASERGCEHKETSEMFCAKCGKPMWVDRAPEEIDMGHGHFEGNDIVFYGSSVDYIQVAGLEAKKLLEKLTLPEAIKVFVKFCKEKFNIDVQPSEVDLLYGEAGDG